MEYCRMPCNHIYIPCVADFEAVAKVLEELRTAQKNFPHMKSAHEGYAILKEEVDELWDAIKSNDHAEAMKEAVQVAAMALRFLIDVKGPNKVTK